MTSIRRDVTAILVAHRLDPARRELYVEGRRDRLFLLWLVGDSMSLNSRIVEMQFVEVANMLGGERGRLIAFAERVQNENASIRCFADADFDRLLARDVPANVWLTDLRDLEGYMLREACLRKVFHIAANTDAVDARQLLEAIRGSCRLLTALRILSIREGLDLPFQRTGLQGHVAASRTGFTLNFDSYLGALLQNAGISLGRQPEIASGVNGVMAEFAETEIGELIHGKDAVRLLAEVLLQHGVARHESEGHLFMSFESEMVDQYATLREVLNYLQAA